MTAHLARANSALAEHGTFRVEMLGSQESLDLDSGKFYTVRAVHAESYDVDKLAHERFGMFDTQEYILRCTWTDRTAETEVWDVVRRYREFSAIDILLREKYPSRASLFPLLPSKKLFGSSLSAEFVDKRQRDLGYYVSSILHSSPLLVQDEIIDSFLDIKRHILQRAREMERKRLVSAQGSASSQASSNRTLSLMHE